MGASFGRSLSRRRFLALGGLGAAGGLLLPRRGVPVARAAPEDGGVAIGAGHVVRPRDVWGANLPPTGPMAVEEPGDVRFLLVHHSASTNNYSAGDSIGFLRSFYNYHTSATKGWPDIAYNFLVDRYGNIFEGRHGSIVSPVRGDATGGSQGFALLACFIGDHRDVAPTGEAQSAMVALLAWLAGAYSIDPAPGATTEFVSRGSNLHPAGTVVETPTITGHRTMSRTTCPGDEAFALVEHSFPEQVAAALASMTQDPIPSTAATVTSTAAATTSTTPANPAPATTQASTAPTGPPDTTTVIAADTTTPASVPPTDPAVVPVTEPPPPTSVQPTNPIVAEDLEVASSARLDRALESAPGPSPRVIEVVRAAVGTLLLGGGLWLRRRLNPSPERTPEG